MYPAKPVLNTYTVKATGRAEWQAATKRRPVRVHIRSGAYDNGVGQPVCAVNVYLWV